MVGVEEMSFAAVRQADDHAGSLSSLHLRHQTCMALICIKDAPDEVYQWPAHVTHLAASPQGKRRSGPLVK